jgi:cobaltochelatase CobT
MKSENLLTNQVKENLTSTLRTMLSNKALQVEFDENLEDNFFSWNQNLVETSHIKVPKNLSDLVDEDDFLATSLENLQKHRAASDLGFCYLSFFDRKIHSEKNFEDQKEQKIFDEFEKVRVISCIKNSYLGVVKNILSKVESNIDELSANISIILLEQIFDDKILPKTRNFAEDLAKQMPPKILTAIKNLAQKIDNQQDFAKSVAEIFEMLKSQENPSKNEKKSEKNQPSKEDLNNFGAENIEAESQENLPQDKKEESSKPIDQNQKFSQFTEEKFGGEALKTLDKQDFEGNGVEFKNLYKIFTSKFDEVIFPQKLIAKNELEFLRDQLDLKMAKLKTISKKMSLKLKKKLMSKRDDSWQKSANLGILNRKKLTRIILNPLAENLFIETQNHQRFDTALTILLDNSGSMRGQPIVMSALACEIIALMLEKFSIKTEIIGFTTANWKGGKSRKAWESLGKPKNPGRLNDLRHIIYKHFNQNFKKSKANLGLMLKEGVLKENIDGEALLFARSRLMQQSQKRKILMVISDGTPVDDSTSFANDQDILNNHLIHVINKIEKAKKIEIVGVGIGHATEDFYRNSIAIKSLEELGDVMIEKLAGLL